MKKAFFEKGARAVEIVEVSGGLWIKNYKEVGNPPAYDMSFSWKTSGSEFENGGSYKNKKEFLINKGYKLTKEEEVTKEKVLTYLILQYGKEEGRLYVLTGYPHLMAIYDPLTQTLWHNQDFTVSEIIAWVTRGFKI